MSWISVKNILPDVDTPVLVVVNGEISLGELRRFDDPHEGFTYWPEWDWYDVTHWMPLPTLPIIDAGVIVRE